MTIKIRRAPVGRQRAQCPCFLFGAKEASAGAKYRGVKQRFPYRCNEAKTSWTARRRSSWSPRRRHHQSLWQAKTTFVRIACTSCLPSNWPLWHPFPLNIWGEDQASINRTSHRHRSPLILDWIHSILTSTGSSSSRTPLLLRWLIHCTSSSSAPRGNPPPHWSRVLHHNGGPNQYKSCVSCSLGSSSYTSR